MKTFKQFLQEAKNIVEKWSSRTITDAELANVVRERFNKKEILDILAYDESPYLFWRGDDAGPGPNKAIEIDPTVGQRASKDSNGIYMLLMRQSKALKNVPDRSKSLICVTNPADARQYGKVYAIIPHAGVKVAYASEYDVFSAALNLPRITGSNHPIGVEELSNQIEYTLAILGKVDALYHAKYTSFDALQKMFSSVPSQHVALAWALAFVDHAYWENVTREFAKADNVDTKIKRGVSALRSIYVFDGEHTTIYEIEKKNPGTVKAIIEFIESNKDSQVNRVYTEVIKIGAKNLLQYVADTAFNNKEGFTIGVSNSVKTLAQVTGECWFSGKGVMVDLAQLRHVIRRYELHI